jgi:hypothetical protein
MPDSENFRQRRKRFFGMVFSIISCDQNNMLPGARARCSLVGNTGGIRLRGKQEQDEKNER